VKHVEREFWRYFTQKVRQRLAKQGKKKFFMFGEAFDGRDQLVGSFTKNDAPPKADAARENSCVHDGKEIAGDQLDSVFYFPQYFQAVRDVFQLAQSTDRVEKLWADRDRTDGTGNYGIEAPKEGAGVAPYKTLVNFLDNHDVPHFLYSGTGREALHSALFFIFTAQGIPCVYYGTEQEFAGGNDPANREDLWTSGYDTSNPTFRWIKRISRLRRGYPALVRGDTNVIYSTANIGEEPDAGMLAYERAGGDAGDGYALVVFNTNRDHESTTAAAGNAMKTSEAVFGKTLVDVLSEDKTKVVVGADGTLEVTLPPVTAALFVPEDQVSSKL
jgi:glycosidase